MDGPRRDRTATKHRAGADEGGFALQNDIADRRADAFAVDGACARNHRSATTKAATNTPATDAIGPRELQGFSLPGTKTQPAAPAPAPTTATPPPTARTKSAASVANAPQRQRSQRDCDQSARHRRKPLTAPPRGPLVQPTAARRWHRAHRLPFRSVSQTDFSPPPRRSSAGDVHPGRLSFLPWLIAALALAGGIAFLLWQRRPREAYAGGPEFDLFVPPEP